MVKIVIIGENNTMDIFSSNNRQILIIGNNSSYNNRVIHIIELIINRDIQIMWDKEDIDIQLKIIKTI